MQAALRRYGVQPTWQPCGVTACMPLRMHVLSSSHAHACCAAPQDAAGSTHEVWFPTPRSLYTRLEAARKAGTGISIWELGQGMARFMELL